MPNLVIEAEKLKQFTSLTGLRTGHFTALLVVISKSNKTFLNILESSDSELLETLEAEGLVEITSYVKQGRQIKDYSLTKDGKELKKKLFSASSGIDPDAEEVLLHLQSERLSQGLNKGFTLTKSNADKVTSRLKKGFTVAQFRQVNTHFVAAWREEMFGGKPAHNYLIPRTLYNEKFPDRVDEAEQSTESNISHSNFTIR